MAATDVFYRDQKKVNWIFAVSCLAMLVSVVWMFADDFNRPYKKDQKVFREVEEELNKRALLALAPDAATQKQMVESEAAVVKAREVVAELKAKVNAAVADKLPAKVKLETKAQNSKADFDAFISYFNIAVEKDGPDSPTAREWKAKAEGLVGPMNEMRVEMEQMNDSLAKVAKEEFTVEGGGKLSLEAAESKLKEIEANHKKLTGDFDRFVKLTSQKRWTLADSFRGLPVIDGFAPPVKIKQTFHEDLPIDYGGFKYVTRYDRCTTCHLGIEKQGMDKTVLAKLTTDPMKDETLKQQFENARKALEERQKANRDGRQDLNLLSGKDLQPDQLPLSESQISMFASHPRLDLYVDATSKHPVEKFGCTSCHNGQGSATGFVDATHTPNDLPTMEKWKAEHHWRSIHDWDTPMYPPRFAQAACIKCHHQPESMITESVKDEAPKLMKGYNLVRELGCFGCHEIAGMKSGRWVGPDLRLEPEPPLESLSPAERAKRLEDTANPPGTQRKVGPSLYRIAQKTNPEWSAKWMKAPRVFRPDTKMPHFYLQANNVPEALPDDQKKFPDAEVRAVTQYLFSKSQAYSKDKPLPAAPAAPADGAAKTAQIERGRHLFATKGCVACHKHEGLETAGANAADGKPQPALTGESNFGPELSKLAAKIDPKSGRDWLVQWLLDPTVHSPRTLMPSVHLTQAEAADVAGWLLSNTPNLGADWDNLAVDKPETATLQTMAKMYLRKSGLTSRQVNDVIQSGFSESDLAGRPADADERELAAPVNDEKLMNYIGKKAISNLGCYACHNIPGFEGAKPIGVALNDWGRKGVDRIAFEDSANYVQKHYHLIDSWNPAEKGDKADGHDHGHAAGGKPLLPLEKFAPYDTSIQTPYEKYFADMLEHGHQHREGFLHLKLMSPRSYDYNRVKDWNDRTRMPQFKFARTKKKEGESDTDYKARATREEAEARDAVMTFVLGLIAEPIPTKFVYQPTGDRKAEIEGYKVLEKYNCNSCHLIRPGQFELNISDSPVKLADGTTKPAREVTMEQLLAAHKFYAENEASDPKDRIYPEHVAWGAKMPVEGATKLTARALPTVIGDGTYLRLSEALGFRYTDPETKKPMTATIPANVSAPLQLVPETMKASAPSYGGTFALQLKRYLTEWDAKVYGDVQPLNGISDETGQGPNGYAAVPPSLLYEGERVRPDWLYQFLLNPKPIRKIPVLQMPKFNMSDEEAMTLVNYFTAVNRAHNPAIGLTGPYERVAQRDESYLLAKTKEYVAKLKANNLYDERVKELKPVWATATREALAAAERRQAQLKAIGDEAKVKEVQTEIDGLKSQLGANDFPALKAKWEEREAYVADAWKLMNYKDAQCLSCHQIGPATPTEYRAPNLHEAAARLRPEWSERWIAYPQRLMPYASLMQPLYKPAEAKKHAEESKVFIGTPDEQIRATRDLLMLFPQVADWPVIKYRVGPVAFGGAGPAPAAPAKP
ncbi:MAG: cytochrome c [Gemmataceae bacterium]|nr:cytochrome c [Gemmataceae bacterium]